VSAAEINNRSHDRNSVGVMDLGHSVEVKGVEGNKRRWLLATAAAVLVIGMIGSIAVLERSPEPSSPAVSDDDRPVTTSSVDSASSLAPTSVMPDAGVAPTVLEVTITQAQTGRLRPDLFPIVRDPDVADAFGQYSAEASRTPRVTGLVGRLEGNLLSDAIRIELRTPPIDVAAAGAPTVVEIDGTALDVYVNGDTSTVILPGDLTIAVSGTDPVSFLRETGLDVVSFDPVSPFESVKINEAALPNGYKLIIEPDAESIDALSAYTATSLANSDGPGVTVSLANPLASFAIRDVVERAEVNGTPAWGAATPGGYTIIWPVSESTWAQARVRGGPDVSLTLAESVDFAATVDFVNETDWRANYRVPEPGFDDTDRFIGIDAGSADGIEVGMIVQSNGLPIGRVAEVTDSSSDVLPVSHPDFSIDVHVSGTASSGTTSDCRVRGGNDHVGFVCDRTFSEQEQAGVEVVAIGNSPTIVQGTSFGTITSIIDINGEPVGLLDLLAEFPIAGDTATVVLPS